MAEFLIFLTSEVSDSLTIFITTSSGRFGNCRIVFDWRLEAGFSKAFKANEGLELSCSKFLGGTTYLATFSGFSVHGFLFDTGVKSLSFEIDCLCPGGSGSDWKIPKSNVGKGSCSGDADRGSSGEGRASGGNGFISLSSYLDPMTGLVLALDDLLVGALDPESDSELEVLKPEALDPVLEVVFVLPLD